MTPILLFFVSHCSVLNLEPLLTKTNGKVTVYLTYSLSLLPAPSLLAGESAQLIGPQVYQLMLPFTFVVLLLIPGQPRALSPPVSVQSPILDILLSSGIPHFCHGVFPDCSTMTGLWFLNFLSPYSL